MFPSKRRHMSWTTQFINPICLPAEPNTTPPAANSTPASEPNKLRQCDSLKNGLGSNSNTNNSKWPSRWPFEERGDCKRTSSRPVPWQLKEFWRLITMPSTFLRFPLRAQGSKGWGCHTRDELHAFLWTTYVICDIVGLYRLVLWEKHQNEKEPFSPFTEDGDVPGQHVSFH